MFKMGKAAGFDDKVNKQVINDFPDSIIHWKFLHRIVLISLRYIQMLTNIWQSANWVSSRDAAALNNYKSITLRPIASRIFCVWFNWRHLKRANSLTKVAMLPNDKQATAGAFEDRSDGHIHHSKLFSLLITKGVTVSFADSIGRPNCMILPVGC